jgi:hypothetical protein
MRQTTSPASESWMVPDPTTDILFEPEMDSCPTQNVGCQNTKQSTEDSSKDTTNTLLDFYYKFFHNPHPYLLPRRRFDVLLRTNRSSIEHLLVVMEFIASTYALQGQSAEMKQRAIDTMLRNDMPLTGFTVQALLLLAISVHCCNGFQLN